MPVGVSGLPSGLGLLGGGFRLVWGMPQVLSRPSTYQQTRSKITHRTLAENLGSLVRVPTRTQNQD